MKTFGYSGTPLIDKLGIKPGGRIQFVSAPKEFAGLLGNLPDGARIARRGTLGCAVDDTWSGLKFVRRLKDR